MTTTDDLFTSIWGGDAARVGALLAETPTLANTANAGGMSPLLAATYARQPAMVDLLLAAGAAPDIFVAAAQGRLDWLRDLLARNPGLVAAYSADGWTALHLAGHFGADDAARLLLESGANANARSHNEMDNLPLHAACAGSPTHAVVALLLDAGADVNARQHGGFTPLHEVAQNGVLDLAHLLLERGADTSIRTDDGKTARELALEQGHAEMVALLEAHSGS